jgi:hypothetical protein
MRPFLILSAVINAGFIAYIIGVLPFLLFVSVAGNVFLFFYIRNLLQELKKADQKMENVFDSFFDFADHLHKVYGLDQYQEEATLRTLVEHMRYVIEDIEENYQELFVDNDEENVDERGN